MNAIQCLCTHCTLLHKKCSFAGCIKTECVETSGTRLWLVSMQSKISGLGRDSFVNAARSRCYSQPLENGISPLGEDALRACKSHAKSK